MKDDKCPNIGGQAVIEGVMMKGTEFLATAVRRENGEIVYRRKKILKDRFGLFEKPFFRGVFMLFETLIMGIKELMFSAVEAGEEEEEELTDFQLGLTLFISLGIGISLFILLPSIAGNFFGNNLTANIVEGAIRLSLFVTYVYLISLSKDIRRVFQYHGAEHKSIYAYENNEELTVENVKKYTKLHPRCGTSFLILVMVLTIIIYSFVDTIFLETDVFWIRTLTKFGLRLVFLPLVASIAYEFQRYTSRNLDKPLIRIVAGPGLLLQRITTREPDLEQLEVGIVALRAALGEENIENASEVFAKNKL